MRSPLPLLLVLSLAVPASALADEAASPPVLRVCADPNNLPYSDSTGAGFENRLAELIGESLGARVEYTWWAQRRGFIRNTLKARRCDVIMGVPQGLEEALTTQPYYRSSYALIYRKDAGYHITGLDDPRLRNLRIGVHLIGDGISPPARVLAQHGVVDNVVGYSIFSDYSEPNPPARLIEAVASGDIDVAVSWGPLAGYYAQLKPDALEVVPLPPSADPALPFQFSIAMGVRPGDTQLKQKLDAVLQQKRPQIHALLAQYGVPVVDEPSPAASPASAQKER